MPLAEREIVDYIDLFFMDKKWLQEFKLVLTILFK
jgi:hypothetical protein